MSRANHFISLSPHSSTVLTTLLFTLTFFFTAHFTAPAVQAQTEAWQGACVYQGDVPTILGVECLIANVLRVAITFIGLAGFVMLLVGAYRYLISGGNSKGMDTARNTLTFAVVGLVVALSAFLIVRLIAEFTGVDSILNFSIRAPQ